MFSHKNNKKTSRTEGLWTNPVSVSVSELVAHNQHGRLLLRPGRIHAAQAGSYISPFKGRGMEFVEARPYQPGDDIRHLDWRLTARLGKAHSKIFQEERERSVLLWVDLASSMFFATRGAYKAVMAAHASALVGWSSIHNGDRLGGLLFSGNSRVELRPQRGNNGALHFIRQLVNHPAWQDTDALRGRTSKAENLIRLRRVTPPGSLVFLFSDMRNLDQQGEIQLGRLARNNELVLCFLYDQLESELPPPGTYRITNGEKVFVLETGNHERRERYADNFSSRRHHLQQLCSRLGIRFIPLATHTPILPTLQAALNGGPAPEVLAQ